MKVDVVNPKFNFTEKQTNDIMMAAYHLNMASEFLTESNGMLALIYNAQAIELLDQAGLSQAFLDELGLTKTIDNEIKLPPNEKKEVDDIFAELEALDKSDAKLKTNNKNIKTSKSCKVTE